MSVVKTALKESKPGQFTFTWSIQNYSYCPKKEDEWIHSPSFLTDFTGDTKLWLSVYPGGDKAPGFVSCYPRGGARVTPCHFAISILKSDGEFKEFVEDIYDDSYGYYEGCRRFISLEELHGPEGYLVNGTLTLRLQLWKTGSDIPQLVKWEACSRINVSKLDYTWILKDVFASDEVLTKEFKRFVNIEEFFTEGTHMKLQVDVNDDSLSFGIEVEEPKKRYFFICVVYVLNANGKENFLTCGEHFFDTVNSRLSAELGGAISADKRIRG